MLDTTTSGRLGETIAATYLELAGYRIRRRNVRFGPREIDLVVTRERELVFVEVKLRSSDRFGGAMGALTWRKRRELWRVFGPLFGELRRRDWHPRIDFIAIERQRGGVMGLTLRHFPNVVGSGARIAG